MSALLQLFILIPLAGFVLSLLLPRRKEKLLSGISIAAIGVQLLLFFLFAGAWLWKGAPVLDVKHFVLFKTGNFEIFAALYFDKTTAVFAGVGAILAFLVGVFSRYYLHREEGFKRFFNTLLFFYTGYNMVIFSGNFETLFVGWEVLGISSFLLIAFYRDRYLPVRNGFKAISIYRLSDVCLMLAMWMSHQIWHENITFSKLSDTAQLSAHIIQYPGLSVLMAVMLLTAAVIKSAQLPFSSWLPRAMEGPTTSSAIFYGSLSLHIGIFLLLRSFPLWESMPIVKTIVIIIGLVTFIISSGIARMQSTVKTQIAYSSIAQLGLMFIEVALGWHMLALIHFAGNAFLRTYQLLVSPSVLSYRIHDQFYNFSPGKRKEYSPFMKKLNNTFYVLSLKEWNLDGFLYRFFWMPFKRTGTRLGLLTGRSSLGISFASSLLGVLLLSFEDIVPRHVYISLPYLFSTIGLLLILKAFSERGDAIRPWLLAFSGQFLMGLALSLNSDMKTSHVLMHMSGLVISGLCGYICLRKAKAMDDNIHLNRFHGYVYERPWLTFVFLLSGLGLLGFPVTPAFVGTDLLFSNIRQDQPLLLIIASLSFIFVELSVIRIYIRVFLGQHKKTDHAIAYRSS